MRKIVKLLTLAAILVFASLSFITCDLLNGIPTDDLMDKIDQDIAWANAEKAVVTVAYPLEWGASPQYGSGKCGDTRVGYEFDVEFSPNPEYALLGWRAYPTDQLTDEWMDNPAKYFASQIAQIGDVSLPLVSKNGGSGKVKINTTEPVTLIPFCRKQPRIIRSSPNETTTSFGRKRSITVVFAAALDPATVNSFDENGDENGISIKRQTLDSNGRPENDTSPIAMSVVAPALSYSPLSCYKNPSYDNDTRTLTIEPRDDSVDGILDGPPTNSKVTLSLGTAIKGANGTSWEEAEVFSWIVNKYNCYLENWNARYENGKIKVSWTLVGDAVVKVRYKERGAYWNDATTIPVPSDGADCEIPVAAAFDPSVHNDKGYEILIDLISEGENIPMDQENPIRIWNIPGMEVTSNKPAIPITNADELKNATADLNGTYVLVSDISTGLAGQWIPIGLGGASAFTGKFYGLGKTITFPAAGFSFANNVYLGLFGFVSGALIQDLTVVYNGSVEANYTDNQAFIGGIVGSAAGSAVISNCTVKGGSGIVLKNTSSSASGVNLGGVIGIVQDGVLIDNCTADLDVSVTKNNAGAVNAGSLAGYGISNAVIRSCTASGDVTVNGSNTSSGDVNAGAVVGSATGSVTINSCAGSGKVTISNNSSGIARAGGVVGYMNGTVSINSSSATVNLDLTKSGGGGVNAGGIAGCAIDTTRISDCTAVSGDIIVGDSTSFISYAGGIVGYMESRAVIENSANKTAAINVAVTKTSAASGGYVYTGGAVGRIYGTAVPSGSSISNLTVTGNVTVTKNAGTSSDRIYAGGIAGSHENAGKLENLSYSSGTVKINQSDVRINEIWTGGIAGYCYDTKFENCTFDSSGKIIINSAASENLKIGGIAAYAGNSCSLNTCYANGSINVINADSYNPWIGGIAGSKEGSGPMQNCTAAGNITVNSNVSSGSGKGIAGGVAGYLIGSGSPSMSFRNCYYNTETIDVTFSGSGDAYAGGVVGYVYNYANFDGCESKAGTIKVTKTAGSSGNLYAGGFAGLFYYASLTTARNSGSQSPLTVMNQGSGGTNSGGFVGSSYARIEDCWSTGMVKSTASSVLRTGGLVGNLYSEGDSAISKSYATGDVIAEDSTDLIYAGGLAGYSASTVNQSWALGNVQITETGNSSVYAGGLVGYIVNCPIQNCYALGDVDAGTTGSGEVHTGGLAGYSDQSISSSFAQGSVKAASVNGDANAGGVVGKVVLGTATQDPSIYSTAALGKSVIATSVSGTPRAWRIYGDFPDAQSDNNYARVTTKITGETNTLPAIPAATYLGIDARNGGDVTVSRTAEEGFWKGPGSEMNYSGSYWNFDAVTTVGHPKLGIGIEDETPVEIPYNITPSPTSNGSFTITVPGTDGTTATPNATVTITAVPGSNYQVDTVTVTPTTGSPPTVNGTGNTRTFTMPASDVTVSVTFEKTSYTVTLSPSNGQPTGGRFAVDKTTATMDDTVTITLSNITTGYRVNTVKVTNTTTSADVPVSGTGTTYTFTMPASNVTVAMTFTNVYATNPALGVATVVTNGKFTVTGTGTYNQTATITATPDSGYQVGTVKVTNDTTGTDVSVSGTGNTRTFTMPASDVTVSVTFIKTSYTVTLSPSNGRPTGGRFAVDKTTATMDDTVTITLSNITTGYRADTVKVTNNTTSTDVPVSGTDTMYTFTMPASNVTVAVTFTNVYTITSNPVIGGEGTFTVPVTGTYNSTVTITATPDSGYHVKAGGVTVTPATGAAPVVNGTGPYTFTMPGADVTVDVVFEADPDPSP